jgi:hypothetical protein
VSGILTRPVAPLFSAGLLFREAVCAWEASCRCAYREWACPQMPDCAVAESMIAAAADTAACSMNDPLFLFLCCSRCSFIRAGFGVLVSLSRRRRFAPCSDARGPLCIAARVAACPGNHVCLCAQVSPVIAQLLRPAQSLAVPLPPFAIAHFVSSRFAVVLQSFADTFPVCEVLQCCCAAQRCHVMCVWTACDG